MWTKEKIETFMTQYGFKPKMAKPEVKELSNILSADEQLIALLEGDLARVHNRVVNGNGLVIATNKRVVFFRKSLIGTVTKEEIQLTKISASSYRKGLLVSSVIITTSSNDAVVENCDKTAGKKFNDALLELISESNQQKTDISKQPSALEQLEKLFELKQKGILTEEEYITQKSKLLNQA